MNLMITSATANVAAAYTSPNPDSAPAILRAAQLLLPHLEAGTAIDTALLGATMSAAFGGSDAEGRWVWKDAYDACEAVQILFLRKFGAGMTRRANSTRALLAMLAQVAALLPTHTRRDDTTQALQQLSTPLPLAFVAAHAAGMTAADLVLEPSAGTGLLAIFAELSGARLHLNELATKRAAMLEGLFPAAGVTRFDAAHIDDYLHGAIKPSVVLMNPPFSVAAKVKGRSGHADFRHLCAAFARLADDGRLVAITGANLDPASRHWRAAFLRLQHTGRVVFSAPIDGRAFAKHGTTALTRLTVIDKVAAADPDVMPAPSGSAASVAELLGWLANLPDRVPPAHATATPRVAKPQIRAATRAPRIAPVGGNACQTPDPVRVVYEPVDWAPMEGTLMTEAIYDSYALQSIRIPDAHPHPIGAVRCHGVDCPAQAKLSTAVAG